jgi:hypothetical protein
VLSALLGQIKGILGKPYLIAGLLPSIALVEGIRFYRLGHTDLEQEITRVLTDPDKVAGDALVRGVLMLAVGLVLFAARGAVLEIIRGMAGRLLTPIRRRMIERHRSKWRSLASRSDRLLWDLTVVDWPRRGKFGFAKPKYLLAGFVIPEEATAIQASAEGRKRLAEAAAMPNMAHGRLRDLREPIQHGLTCLYARAVNHVSECRDEIKLWRALVTREEVATVLAELNLVVERESAEAYTQLQRYPTSPERIQPTELGNRFAALDDYAYQRYGISTSTLWTRLWGILSKAEQQEVADGQLGVEVAANIVLTLSILTLFVAGDSVRIMVDSTLELEWRAAAFIAAPAFLVVAGYRVAVHAVGNLADRIIRLVDLKRLRLLQALGFGVPASIAQEQELFQELQLFFDQASALTPRRKLTEPKDSG